MEPVEYVVFDLDGLLIDSERVYTDITNEILAPYGKEMTIEIKAGLMGKPERAASEYLLAHFPGIELTIEDYIKERRVKQDMLWPSVSPLPGALKLISHLHKHSIPIAIATGSLRRSLILKTSHLPELIGPFKDNIICADDVTRGKPNPDVFLLAAERLGRRVGTGDYGALADELARAERRKGLVFEDAIPGVQAGVRAGMQVVWVPDTSLTALNEGRNLGAHEILTSLEEFKPEKWGLPAY
ncbi:HAD-like protein [Hysterangium stoloniferum]|nr:HAD-like protein [Hysterangium stoloniferum]